MNDQALRLAPLGGLGEIGLNCLALEQRGEMLLVDCGVTFPQSDHGIDILHPRFDHALEREGALAGVVITHGHEDHIGALPYLLRAVDVPVYGPAHALELVKRRLDEHGFKPGECELITTPVRREYQVGSFVIEPLRVTHSIADATALAIRTDAGIVIHTGDFKLDDRPPDGELTDLPRFAELGDEGVSLLLSDSTNADAEGRSASEFEVAAALEAVVSSARTRVFVGMFASNVPRLKSLGEIAKRSGRRICLLGRSVVAHVRAAQATGYLSWPSDLVISPELAAQAPRDRVLVIAGGTQAERGSGLARLATGTHHVLRIDPGDVVVMSSRVIPGNDRPVVELWGSLLRVGADLVTHKDHRRIHASGHANRAEQLEMIEAVRPRSFLPVHGTRYHLTRHAELASHAGVGDVLVAENGDHVEIRRGGALGRIGRVPVGRVATYGGEPIDDELLAERAQLGRAGIVFVSLVLGRDGRCAAVPRVVGRGVLDPRDAKLPRRIGESIGRAIDDETEAARSDDEALITRARLVARRLVEETGTPRPIVSVSLTRVPT